MIIVRKNIYVYVCMYFLILFSFRILINAIYIIFCENRMNLKEVVGGDDIGFIDHRYFSLAFQYLLVCK